jgi:hypothetical protein
MKTRALIWMAAPSMIAIMLADMPGTAQQPAPLGDADGAAATATQAYIYGYPLVTMYMTRLVFTNAAVPDSSGKAPINQFGSLYRYPSAAFKDVVAPNVNTLYTQAHFDLRTEPIIVHLPDTKGRYYLMQLLDAWSNVIGSPGKRTTGTNAQEIALIGPSWQGQLPKGITHAYRSPTNNVWAIVRIQANGSKDYLEVNALQNAIRAVPLSAYGTPYTAPAGAVDPSVDMTHSVKDQVNALPADSFFNIMTREMMVNPPAPADSLHLARMANIGIVVGRQFSMDSLDPATARAVQAGFRAGPMRIGHFAKTMGRNQNGWQSVVDCGQFGTHYMERAAVAVVGFGCNLADDAFYPTTMVDAQGRPLTGSNRYVIHFDAGQTPPVDAFWSVTLYDSQGFLVDNSINRSAVSSWMDLEKNPDGSIDIYVQNQSPGSQTESNWLPAPTGNFQLMMRLYWPRQDAILGQWVPPGVQIAR